jgi:hypothetical protein
MKYVSIDIETTGLCETKNQIVEFGCVLEDMTHDDTHVDNLPYFNAVIVEPGDEYTISPYVIDMHVKTGLFDRIGQCDKDRLKKAGGLYFVDWGGKSISMPASLTAYCYPNKLETALHPWLKRHIVFPGMVKVIPAGKNFYGFDYRFLKPLLPRTRFHHRCLDPIMYYLKKTDREPPDLQLCCERAGMAMSNYHSAVGDARMVVELIRRGMKNEK